MDGYRRGLLLAVAVGLVGLSGSQCPNMIRQYTHPQPPALPPSPTLQQVIEVVNRNNSQIHSFWTTEARLSGTGFPALRASVAFERPLRFRLQANTALTGPELDFGSNDQHFWFWVKRNDPQAVYFCRHDQFAASRARQMVPVDPYWLIEALGIAEFDPGLPHHGPFAIAANRVEIRTIRNTPEGATTKFTIVDTVRGQIVEQRIHDAQDRLIATAVASGHRRDPASGLVMPTSVEVGYPAAQFSLRLDLGNVQINRPQGNPVELWTMPSYEGSPVVDLGNPAGWPPAASSPDPVSLRPYPPSRPWR